MSRIYLVQNSGFDGADGYSFALLQGGHPLVLVSFADYVEREQETILKPHEALGRRRLIRRATKTAKKRTSRHLKPQGTDHDHPEP